MKLFNFFKKKKKPVSTFNHIEWLDGRSLNWICKIMTEDTRNLLNEPYNLLRDIEKQQELDTWIREYMGVKKRR